MKLKCRQLGGVRTCRLSSQTPRYGTRPALPFPIQYSIFTSTNVNWVKPAETILISITMKHTFTACLSLVVLSQTLGVLTNDAVNCYAIDAANEITLTFNSLNLCASHCGDAGYSVFAARGPQCSCLDNLPSSDKKRDASQCNAACPGYALENCESVQASFEVSFLCTSIER